MRPPPTDPNFKQIMPDNTVLLKPRIFLWWLLLYLLLWWVLASGGWFFGVPCAALAAYVATRLQLTPWRLRWLHAFPLGWFLLRAMFDGAVDVARRILAPSCRIDPMWVQYSLTSGDRRVRYLVSLIIGLLPGTLGARIQTDQLLVHVIDQQMEWRDTLVELEHRLEKLIIGHRT